MELKLDDVVYNIKTNADDITFEEYFELMKIIDEREYKVIGKAVDGEDMLEEVIPQSDEFRNEKILKIVEFLSKIPRDILTIPAVYNIVLNQIDNLVVKDEAKMFSYDDEAYTYKNFYDWTFQQFCDFDSFIQEDKVLAFLAIVESKGNLNRPYDRYHNNMSLKQGIKYLPSTHVIPVFNSLVKDYYEFKSYFKHLFEYDTHGYPSGPNIKDHCKRFKWEDTIVTLSESNVFNSPNGTLSGVRNARATEVLEYLNLKRSRDNAEYLDDKIKNRGK